MQINTNFLKTRNLICSLEISATIQIFEQHWLHGKSENSLLNLLKYSLRGWFGFRRYKNFFQQCLLRIRLRISISVLRVPSGNSSIVSVSIDGMSSTWSLNSLLFHKYVGRFVEENTLPLQILLTFHDTCKSVAKCSRSVSRFRTCGFNLSLPKGSKCGVG